MQTDAPRSSTPLVDRHERVVADAIARQSRRREGSNRTGAAVGMPAVGAGGGVPGPTWLPYGPPRELGEPLQLVATYGAVELEYAAIRSGAGLFDASHRGTLIAAGAERRDFLNRMVTQQLVDLVDGAARPAFWLNRKGRIDADLLLAEIAGDEHDGSTWIDLDRHVASSTAAALMKFVFSESVEIVDATESTHRLALHGREALAALTHVAGGADALLADRTARRIRIGDVDVTVVRRDECGEPGLQLSVAVDSAAAVWDALCAAPGVRPIGWHAYNIARIESGTPLFQIDFDVSSLPHETGVLRDRVSFTKGCYLGQEVVARMESLGKPKQMLVGLRIEGVPGQEIVPDAGSSVCAVEGASAESTIGPPVGTITSSTISPMLGAAPIAFAMVRTAHAATGAKLLVFGEGAQATATVTALRAWGSPSGERQGA